MTMRPVPCPAMERLLVGAFRAEARGGMVGDERVMAPFTGEVAWMRPEGRKPPFVGTVTALAFEFAP